MVQKNTAGFTLIEITLAMAISSSLAVIILMGFSGLRGQAQFSNAIDGLKEQMTAIRTEALTTVNTDAGAGGDQARVVLGRVVTFDPSSLGTTITVQKIVTDSSPTLAASSAVSFIPDRTITIPWGVKFINGPGLLPGIVQVAFIRSAIDGTNITAISGGGGWRPSPTYSNVSTVGAVTHLNFVDPAGRAATIDIDPLSNSVSRTFQ